MQKTRLNYFTLLSGAFLVAAVPLFTPHVVAQPYAGTTTAPVEELGLTVVATGGVKSENPSIGQLDAGTIDSFSKPKIEQDFILRNDRKAPITIGRLQPTCGCTSVILGEGTDTTKTLAPGEEVKVRASVDVTRFHGPIHKAVRAYASDGATLLATMEITATIQDPIVLSTRHLDFGAVDFGKTASIPLDVTFSARVVAAGKLQLVSSNPDISVTPGAETAATAGELAQRHYTVAISPKSSLGQVAATLSFALSPIAKNVTATNVAATNVTSEKDTSAEEARLASALEMTQVVVSAEVTGKINAAPKMIVFGASRPGSQQIRVTGAPALLKNLKIASLSPWIKVNAVPAPKPAEKSKSAMAAAADFAVSLDPHAPPGAIETKITVTASDGEHLNISVLADVPGVTPPAQ